MIDPKHEAERLITTAGDSGFLIFLGLGGGFAPSAALEHTNAYILVIDFDNDGINELLASKDYSKLVKSDRFSLLIDPDAGKIKSFILENYKPALCGGIKTIPLRTRTEHDMQKFETAAEVIQTAIEIAAGDYSVQAHFGMRWFSNIIRNIKTIEKYNDNFRFWESSPIKEAAIVAAGPSLDHQMSSLAEKKAQNVFIISTDTALGALLHNGIEPDAVISIDCQHISYYHFLGCNLSDNTRSIPLFLDIASPPVLSNFPLPPVFFLSGHPLAQYINAAWRHLPQVDTSGGNVTYAGLSLAQTLGAERITLFGADFSYINCQTYARGTYIYPYFLNRQNRLSPMEAKMSVFLYRSPFLLPQDGQKKNYYETSSLRFYRKNLEEKVSTMSANVVCEKGFGATVTISNERGAISSEQLAMSNEEKINHGETRRESEEPLAINSKQGVVSSGRDFLAGYRDDIVSLPEANGAENYLKKLNVKEKQVFTTLLPYMAATKKRNTEMGVNDLIEEVKRRCVEEIEKTLAVF
jgi:hypothetical protein